MSWYDAAIAAWYRSKEQERALNAQGIEQGVQGLTQGLQQARQDAIANQVSSSMANSGAYAPRAAAVNPGSIPAGVPTAGTAPMSGGGGGMLGFQLRNAMANQGIENALKRAQIGYYGAHGAAVLQGAGTTEAYRQAEEARLKAQTDALNSGRDPASIAAQRQEEVDYRQQVREAEAHADTMEKLKADVENVHPGAYAQFGKVLSSGDRKGLFQGDFDQQGKWQGNPSGSLITADPSAGTGHPTAKDITAMTPNELDFFAGRAKNIMSSPGGRYVAPVARRAQAPGPARAQGGGNVPQIRNAADYQALPPGSAYRDPSGVLRQKPAGGATAQSQQPSGDNTLYDLRPRQPGESDQAYNQRLGAVAPNPQ